MTHTMKSHRSITKDGIEHVHDQGPGEVENDYANMPHSVAESMAADKEAVIEQESKAHLAKGGKRWRGDRARMGWFQTQCSHDFDFDPEEFMDALRDQGIPVPEEDVRHV